MDAPAYVIDVRSILEDLGGTIVLNSEFELPLIEIGPEKFTPLRPAHLDAAITNTGAGIVASGTIDAELQATCARCLREFPLRVTAPLEGFYVTPGMEHELPEEQEIGPITEGSIDLMEQILAALTLELPFAPVHDENCPGFCAKCGADLVEGPCTCAPDLPDSPFAQLRDLLPPVGHS